MRARLILPLVALGLAACGGDNGTGIKPPDHFSTISITDAGFNPVTLPVQTNTQVTWTVTSGDQSHVIRFTGSVPSGSNPNSNTLTSGQSAATTFLQAGTYTYEDSLHTEHTGSITVQ